MKSYPKLWISLGYVMIGLCLTLSMNGCAAPPLVVPKTPCVPAAYFVPVLKPVPPKKGEAAFLKYVDELSTSWDNLYLDRLKAWEVINEY
jgi:hypothetical protein